MRAILVSEPGGPEMLTPADVDVPPVGGRDIRIHVVAAGVNRADVAQRLGHYPSPPGSPEWPGLEVSGTVAEIGDEVTRFAVGDRVCALLGGGGYAEQVVVNEDLVLPVPDSLDLIEAAALPEAIATVWANVFLAGRLTAGETLLVHGGASGIGTTAIQLARLAGARVAVTASAPKLDACRKLGADILIDYRSDDFVERVLEATDGRGADVILDIIGGPYIARDIDALATDGRILIIANQSGEQASFDPRRLMAKRGSITATTLRARPLHERAAIMRRLRTDAWPWVEQGEFRPLIDSQVPIEQAAEAHRRLESSAHVGKIVLTIG
ncbi:NAD(P)H-quinone oxidoreductase [Salinibacterium sp. ZJ454]|uniref:NAD(P)H-quinone oxidoreductase n=1 Tax=Salinibacterium sp. ZJ454 TaxID=2708339 RepID=UPI0014217A80|nr:NAD(P)H-quinone oxidoreductase [Salinibacterium sp. ZJ454]